MDNRMYEDAIHDIFVNSTQHLMEMMNNGASVFVMKLDPNGDPVEFDLSKPTDLAAITRFHMRHLLTVIRELRESRDRAESLGDDLVAIIAEDMLIDFDARGYVDPRE